MSAPSGRAVRPTPARVKEALFSILGSRVQNARVLDLFAGSGALGFEALSRGATHVTFVESHRRTATALRQTARELALDAQCTIVAAPVERIAAHLDGCFAIVFADPPYAQPYPGAVFAALLDRGTIDSATLIVYEHSSTNAAPADRRFTVVRSARYGSVALAFLIAMT